MTDLPGFGENRAPAATESDSKVITEVAPETVHLPPLVVVGRPRLRLGQTESLTQKAYDAEIFKRYDYSTFSSFEHREDMRLRDMEELQNYADNLLLVGDVAEGRAIKKENSRLFLRPRNPENEYIVSIFNPRIR